LKAILINSETATLDVFKPHLMQRRQNQSMLFGALATLGFAVSFDVLLFDAEAAESSVPDQVQHF